MGFGAQRRGSRGRNVGRTRGGYISRGALGAHRNEQRRGNRDHPVRLELQRSRHLFRRLPWIGDVERI